MATDERPFEAVTANAEQAARQTMDIAHRALGNYFNWLQKVQSASPVGDTDLSKTLLKYAEENVNAAFTFARKLSEAKSLQDVIKLQTEFAQTQINTISEQMRNLGAAYTEMTKAATKTPFPKPTD